MMSVVYLALLIFLVDSQLKFLSQKNNLYIYIYIIGQVDLQNLITMVK